VLEVKGVLRQASREEARDASSASPRQGNQMPGVTGTVCVGIAPQAWGNQG